MSLDAAARATWLAVLKESQPDRQPPADAWDDVPEENRAYWRRVASAAIIAHETARQEALTAEFVEHARTVGSL